jgi:hypothetical protein
LPWGFLRCLLILHHWTGSLFFPSMFTNLHHFGLVQYLAMSFPSMLTNSATFSVFFPQILHDFGLAQNFHDFPSNQ